MNSAILVNVLHVICVLDVYYSVLLDLLSILINLTFSYENLYQFLLTGIIFLIHYRKKN